MSLYNKILETTKGQNEKVVKVFHRHWFNIAQQFFIATAVVIVLVIFLMVSFSYAKGIQEIEMSKLVIFSMSTVLLFFWVYSFFVWIDYYFDMWIVTNLKIINTEQKHLFIRHVSELKYEKIQDVTVEVKGIIGTILNYGDVYIQTAAETERFVFRKVADPYKVKDLIMQLQRKKMRSRINRLSKLIGEEITEEEMRK